MQATSRASYAAALDQLNALAGELSTAALRQVAEELLAVAAVLDRQPRLRRVLTDPSRSGEDRAGLLRELVAAQVDASTARLLGVLVGGRWATGTDLLNGCEELGVQALLAGAEQDGALAEVEDELFRWGQLVTGDPALAAAVTDRAVPVARRAELVTQLLSERVTAASLRLATLALGGFGGRSVIGGVTRLVELAAQRRDRSIAYVTVATPLSEAEEQRLGAALTARYGRDISLKTTVDPQVLGGARVQVGADLYDGTIAYRLAQARTALVSG